MTAGGPLPSMADQLFSQAMSLAMRGDLERAAQMSVRAHELAPGSAEIATMASMLLLQLGHYRQARKLALHAASQQVGPNDLFRIARLLARFEEPEALERLFRSSQWQALHSVPAFAELAQLLGFAGLYDLAFECLARAQSLDANAPDVHYLRGLFEMFSGRMEASQASIRRALELDPRMANAHWLLSMQEKPETAQRHVDQILGVMHAAESGSEARSCFDYSLHHSLHALGRHEEAWQALAHGQAVQHRLKRYSPAEQHALVEALEQMRLPVHGPSMPREGQTGLIFIVGMFRSGTTLLERLLAGHPDVYDGGETTQFTACMREATDRDSDQPLSLEVALRAPDADFAAVRARMLRFADWRAQGKRWLTEKLPSNFLNIGFILHALPEARILHMRRDPIDTCFSNLRTLFRGGAPYASDQRDLADYYLLYRRLMRHWHAVAPGRILDVDYAEFVADPEGQAKRVMAYCGLEYVPNALEAGSRSGMAATASAAHVRQGVLANRGKAWEPYAAHLRPLIEGLGSAYADGAAPG